MKKSFIDKQFEGVFTTIKLNIKFSNIKKLFSHGRKKRIFNSRTRKAN